MDISPVYIILLVIPSPDHQMCLDLAYTHIMLKLWKINLYLRSFNTIYPTSLSKIVFDQDKLEYDIWWFNFLCMSYYTLKGDTKWPIWSEMVGKCCVVVIFCAKTNSQKWITRTYRQIGNPHYSWRILNSSLNMFEWNKTNISCNILK